MQKIHASVRGRAHYNIKGLYSSESFEKCLKSKLRVKEGVSYFNTLMGNTLVYFNSNNKELPEDGYCFFNERKLSAEEIERISVRK